MAEKQMYFADEESGKDKLSRKAKDSPFMIGGKDVKFIEFL